MKTKEKQIVVKGKTIVVPIEQYENIEEAIKYRGVDEILVFVNRQWETMKIRSARSRAGRNPTKMQLLVEATASLADELDGERLQSAAGDVDAMKKLLTDKANEIKARYLSQ